MQSFFSSFLSFSSFSSFSSSHTKTFQKSAASLLLATVGIFAASTASASNVRENGIDNVKVQVAQSKVSASHRAAVEELFTILNLEKNMRDTTTAMLNMMVQQNPSMSSSRDAVQKFLDKYMGYAAVKDDLIGLYTREFTESEIKDLIAFYKTPTGKKSLQKMPILTQSAMQISQMRLQEHLPELEKIVAGSK